MTNKDEKRSVQFLIRITPSEYLEIKKNTSESGLCMSEYARRLITGETILSERSNVSAVILISSFEN